MPDVGKVIKGLEICTVENDFSVCVKEECPYIGGSKDGCCITDLERDALALLKEQKAVTVESIQMDRSDKWGADLTGYCPSCKRPLKNRFNQRFCGECGKPILWEGR